MANLSLLRSSAIGVAGCIAVAACSGSSLPGSNADPNGSFNTTVAASSADRETAVADLEDAASESSSVSDDPDSTTPATPTSSSTSVPAPTTTTDPRDDPGWTGDPFAATESLTAAPTMMPDSGPITTSEPPAQAPSDAGSDTGRPLTDLAEGNVAVPTYIPPGLTLKSAKILEIEQGSYEFSFLLERADPQYQYPTDFTVILWESNGTLRPLGPQFLDDPNHPPVDIAGVTWGWNDFLMTRVARIASFEVMIFLDVLDRSEAERFIEGLRAVPIEQFPVPISFNGADGLSVTYPDDLADAEIVASDDRFEIAALQIGGHACMKLEETTVPAPRTFAPNCWRALNGSGIVDLYPIGDTDTEFLIAGVIDSSVATAVRVTSPAGDSVVVPTGPANEAIDGRFFLARLILDVSNGIRLDQFTIEDASP
jgi:hypothetical protein